MVKFNRAKETIINAAMDVVSKEGVQGATLRSIAERAGISTGALYYYYNTKDLILYDLVDVQTSKALEIAENFRKCREVKGSGTQLWENKQDTATYLVEQIEERILGVQANRIFFYLAQEAIMGNKELQEKFQEKYRLWLEAIEEILISVFGSVRSQHTRALAVIVNATVDGFMLKELLGVQTGVEKELRQIGKLLLQGDLDNVVELLKQ